MTDDQKKILTKAFSGTEGKLLHETVLSLIKEHRDKTSCINGQSVPLFDAIRDYYFSNGKVSAYEGLINKIDKLRKKENV